MTERLDRLPRGIPALRASRRRLASRNATLVIVALLAFALVGGFLYNSLALELQRRDDIEIAEKLDQFLQQARDFGSTQSLVRNNAVFHEVLQSHPAVYLAILNGRIVRRGDTFGEFSLAAIFVNGLTLERNGTFIVIPRGRRTMVTTVDR